MNDDLKREEEERRDRNWDPVQRWKVLQQTIDWADKQSPISRNSPEACQREEARKLGKKLPSHPANPAD